MPYGGFLARGGPYCGVHSAAACLKTTDFYVDTLGGEQTNPHLYLCFRTLIQYPLAAFDFHPDLQELVCDPQ